MAVLLMKQSCLGKLSTASDAMRALISSLVLTQAQTTAMLGCFKYTTRENNLSLVSFVHFDSDPTFVD
jgi:hypothetical protein